MRIVLILLIFPVCLLGAENRVTVATLEWPPYIGKKLIGKGYVNEITVAAFKQSGYNVSVTFYPWARAVYLVEKGDMDVLLPEYYSKRREKSCVYSDPIPGGPVGLFKHKSLNVKWSHNPQEKQLLALWKLREYKFGVVRGYINTKAFDNAAFLIKEEVTNDELNLKKLFGKRVHFIFIDKFVAHYLINNRYPGYKDKLEFMEPAMELKPLYLAFSRKSKNNKKKLKAFNRGLSAIKANGTLKKIMGKYYFLK